ncbi:hypothetical protein AAG570_009336, partial [Ranatra chinensis]
IKQISEPHLHGEGPHWSINEQALYYVDIARFTIHRYEPNNNNHTSLALNKPVSVIIPLNAKDKFVIGYGKSISTLTWDGASPIYKLEEHVEVDKDKPANRFNDGKADVLGNLWIGTMGNEKAGVVEMNQGSLYKFSKDCNVRKFISPVSISNGIAWNKANTLMYYIDSPTRRIDVFNFDANKGNISNRRVLFDFEKNGILGVPDGMTIDNNDNLWIACWGGSKVIQVSGRGKLLRSIELPVERVTSVAFGGNNLSTLYVTTMKAGLSSEKQSRQPNAGALFAIEHLGITGTPSKPIKIECLY